MYTQITLFLCLMNAFLCLDCHAAAHHPFAEDKPIWVRMHVMPANVEITAPCAMSEVDTLEKLQKVMGQLIHMHNVRDRMSMVYGEARAPIPMAKTYEILAGASKLDTLEALASILATLERTEVRKLPYNLLALKVIVPKA